MKAAKAAKSAKSAKAPRPRHETEFLKLTPAQRTAWVDLLRVHREVVQHLDRALAERHNLRLAEWDALVHLPTEEGVRMSDLAETLLFSPSGLTRMMARLEQRGLVSRQRSEEDARETRVCITPKGLELLGEAAPTHNEELRAHFLAQLSADDTKALAALLGKVAGAQPMCPQDFDDTGHQA